MPSWGLEIAPVESDNESDDFVDALEEFDRLDGFVSINLARAGIEPVTPLNRRAVIRDTLAETPRDETRRRSARLAPRVLNYNEGVDVPGTPIVRRNVRRPVVVLDDERNNYQYPLEADEVRKECPTCYRPMNANLTNIVMNREVDGVRINMVWPVWKHIDAIAKVSIDHWLPETKKAYESKLHMLLGIVPEYANLDVNSEVYLKIDVLEAIRKHHALMQEGILSVGSYARNGSGKDVWNHFSTLKKYNLEYQLAVDPHTDDIIYGYTQHGINLNNRSKNIQKFDEQAAKDLEDYVNVMRAAQWYRESNAAKKANLKNSQNHLICSLFGDTLVYTRDDYGKVLMDYGNGSTIDKKVANYYTVATGVIVLNKFKNNKKKFGWTPYKFKLDQKTIDIINHQLETVPNRKYLLHQVHSHDKPLGDSITAKVIDAAMRPRQMTGIKWITPKTTPIGIKILRPSCATWFHHHPDHTREQILKFDEDNKHSPETAEMVYVRSGFRRKNFKL